ncbi:MAG: hypothetical protein K6F70_08885 [Eggerthellaceae bacterium]|nr:hypothetical protein [Eggerthellaceae bacterium]
MADEREEIEANRITKRGFCLMLLLNVILAYFLLSLDVAANMHDLDPTPFRYISPITMAICIIVVVCSMYTVIAQTKRGIMGYPKFVSVDTFPTSTAMGIALVGAVAAGIILFATTCIAEISLVGISEVFWMADFLTALALAIAVFIGIAVMLYAVYKSAKKKQEEILAMLED